MLNVKVAEAGYLDINPQAIVGFEEVKEGMIEDKPKAKCGIFFNVGDGLDSKVLENSYDMISNAVGNIQKGKFIELNVLTGTTDERRMSIPRAAIVYQEEIPFTETEKPEEVPEDWVEPKKPLTVVKVNLEGQVLTLLTLDSREEISAL